MNEKHLTKCRSGKLTILVWLIISVVLSSIQIVSAADDWSVYLYNEIQHEIVRVNIHNGGVESFALGIEPQVRVAPYAISVSSDGHLSAFCVQTIVQGSVSAQTTVVVRDLVNGINLVEIEAGDTLDCHISAYAFAADNSTVVVGIARNAAEVAAADGRIWRLLVIDIASQQITHELNPTLQVVHDASLPLDMAILAEVRAVDSDGVTFTAMPYGVGGIVYGDVYRWDFTSSTLELLYNGSRSNVTLSDSAGNESVWLDVDESLPHIDVPGPMGFFNVIKFQSGNMDPEVIYQTETAVLASPRFVTNGQHLAIREFVALNDPVAQNGTWKLLDRGGNVTRLDTDGVIENLVNAPDGYVALVQTAGNTPAFALNYTNLVTNESQTIWTSEIRQWTLIATSPTPVATNMPTFAPIQ